MWRKYNLTGLCKEILFLTWNITLLQPVKYNILVEILPLPGYCDQYIYVTYIWPSSSLNQLQYVSGETDSFQAEFWPRRHLRVPADVPAVQRWLLDGVSGHHAPLHTVWKRTLKMWHKSKAQIYTQNLTKYIVSLMQIVTLLPDSLACRKVAELFTRFLYPLYFLSNW